MSNLRACLSYNRHTEDVRFCDAPLTVIKQKRIMESFTALLESFLYYSSRNAKPQPESGIEHLVGRQGGVCNEPEYPEGVKPERVKFFSQTIETQGEKKIRKDLKIVKSNHQPIPMMPTKPCLCVPHLHNSRTSSGMVTQQLP